MGGAGYNANAAIDAFCFVYIHRGAFDDATVLQFRLHMCERVFGADNRANLAANTTVEIPSHQVISRHHWAGDSHFVFGFGFLRNTATHFSPKGLLAGR